MDDLTMAHVERARGVGELIVGGGDRLHRAESRARRPEPTTEAHREDPAPRLGAQESTEARRARLERLVDRLNRFFSTGKGIRFQVSSQEDQVVVQVVDQASDEVIRSIPSERLLRFRETFEELHQGMLLDGEA